jgi:hypothetical protein
MIRQSAFGSIQLVAALLCLLFVVTGPLVAQIFFRCSNFHGYDLQSTRIAPHNHVDT